MNTLHANHARDPTAICTQNRTQIRIRFGALEPKEIRNDISPHLHYSPYVILQTTQHNMHTHALRKASRTAWRKASKKAKMTFPLIHTILSGWQNTSFGWIFSRIFVLHRHQIFGIGNATENDTYIIIFLMVLFFGGLFAWSDNGPSTILCANLTRITLPVLGVQ
jgi:hypothetical protein